LSRDILHDIIRPAGLKVEEFRRLLK